MSITLIIGPMFSGKTTELIRLVDRKRIAGKKCLIIKHMIDTRFNTDNNVQTHSQISYEACDIKYFRVLTTVDIDYFKQNYHVVAIEEGHFFTNLCTYCNMMANNKIDVIVSALDSSFKQELFKNVGELIAYAETVVKLTAVCMRCKQDDGSFTIRNNGSTLDILVGGADIYESVCRECLNQFKTSVKY